MTEKLLQFIWKNRYFNQQGLELTTGEPVTIEYPGEENTRQGPDFINARIRINGNYGSAVWNCIYFLPDGKNIVIQKMKIIAMSCFMSFGNRIEYDIKRKYSATGTLQPDFQADAGNLCRMDA